ncbi:MAG TPA: lipopolysaccharide transport periplasmic protein LptA [Woeseiaceae bacterium]|nr:lipopolysaccharide transport periplasmic protein LptA [Woeseiaceae bacterium]
MIRVRTYPLLTLAVVAVTWPLAVLPQEPDLRLPITVDADTLAYDGKNSMLIYQGLKLNQGSLGIEADEGRASNLDFENSVWEFNGNVVITVENGRVECDTAHLKFSGHQLERATITGSPATFEMQRPESDVVTYAEAGRLEYNFDAGTIEFSEQATITEGGNQISSNHLVYNIEEQRINARSAGEGEPRVKIIYTPSDSEAPEDDDSASQAGDDEPDEGEND